MQFDLQQYLKDMEDRLGTKFDDAESRLTTAIGSVDDKVVRLANDINGHETRIVMLEDTRKNLRWFGATTIGALVAAVVGFIVNFFKGGNSHVP